MLIYEMRDMLEAFVQVRIRYLGGATSGAVQQGSAQVCHGIFTLGTIHRSLVVTSVWTVRSLT